MLVQLVDRVFQAFLGFDFVFTRQRVVDVRGPAFFLEDAEDQLLIAGGYPEALDQLAFEPEFLQVGIILGNFSLGAWLRGRWDRCLQMG